jgi:hypothetical protein
MEKELKIKLEREYYNIIYMIKTLQFPFPTGLNIGTIGDVTFVAHLKRIDASALNQYQKKVIQTYIQVK